MHEIHCVSKYLRFLSVAISVVNLIIFMYFLRFDETSDIHVSRDSCEISALFEFSRILVLIVSCDLVTFVARQHENEGSLDFLLDLEEWHREGLKKLEFNLYF